MGDPKKGGSVDRLLNPADDAIRQVDAQIAEAQEAIPVLNKSELSQPIAVDTEIPVASAPLEMKIVEEIGRYSPEVESVMKLAFDRKIYMRLYMRRYRARKKAEKVIMSGRL